MSEVDIMDTGKYLQYVDLSLIMIDYKMISTNVFHNIIQPICARGHGNNLSVFLIVHTYIHRLDHIHLFISKMFPKILN